MNKELFVKFSNNTQKNKYQLNTENLNTLSAISKQFKQHLKKIISNKI